MRLTTKSLGEVCEIGSSKRIYASEYKKSGVPFYRGREIIERQKGKLQLSAELFISEEKYNDIISKFGAPKTGDLLLTSVGTLGIPYVVRSTDKFYFKDGNLTWFKNFKGLLGDYLYYWLLSPYGKAELKKATIGSSQSAFTIVLLKRLKIQVPPLEAQKIISGRIKAYDDLIENNSKRIDKLEAMARLLYRHYFEVPGDTGWGTVRIGDILAKTPTSAKLQKSEYQDEGNYPVIDQGKEYIAGYTNKQEAVIADMLPLTVFGDHTRAVKLVQDPFARGADGTQIVVSDILPPYYLYQTIKDLPLSNEHYARHFKLLKVTEIARPPENILSEFEAKVEPLFKLINTLTKRNRSLAKTRDLLLPRLMSGEIDV